MQFPSILRAINNNKEAKEFPNIINGNAVTFLYNIFKLNSHNQRK